METEVWNREKCNAVWV